MTPKAYRKALIAEANELGLEFPSNVKTTKLQQMVDTAQGKAVGVSAPEPDNRLDYEPGPSPAVKENAPALNPMTARRRQIAERKAEAMKTKIVTITNLDVRDAEFTTTAYLGFENDHFGLARNVPLDRPVELEVSLIEIAETLMMTIHRDEIIEGKRTGNKVTSQTRRYAVSYAADQKPE